MASIGNKIGARDMVMSILSRKPGEMMPPEEALLGMLTIINWGKETQRACDRARNTAGKSAEQIKEERGVAGRMVAMHSQIAASVAGGVSEFGRGLAVARQAASLGGIQQGLGKFADDLNALVDEFNGENDIEFLLERYTALPKSSRIEFSAKSITARSLDVIVEVWINSLLNSPVTHAVNVGSQSVFMGMNLVETQLAGVIGAVRTRTPGLSRFKGGPTDRVMMSDAWAEAQGMTLAMKDALVLAARVAVTEEPGDLASKLDLRRRIAIGDTGNIVEIMEQFSKGNIVPAFINSVGVYARLGSRALITEDEFFKVLARRGYLYKMANKEAADVYNAARNTGADKAAARKQASLAYAQFLEKPPPSAVEAAGEHAKKLTFQQDLQGYAGQMQGTFSHPLMKFILPFYRTPMNIFKEAFDRTLPFTAIRAGLKGSGAELDQALAKLAVGWGTALTMTQVVGGMYDEDFFCTGAGPQDANGRRALRNAKIAPYSCSIRQDDGSYANFTFSRFDPMSMILAMASDYTYFVQNATDMNQIEAATTALVLAFSDYAMELPLLQGVQEFTEIFGGQYGSTDAKLERMGELLGQKVGDAAFSMVPPGVNTLIGVPSRNSFLATMERISGLEDGQLRSKYGSEGPAAPVRGLPPGDDPLFGVPITELPSFFRGWYLSYVDAKGRTPGFSHEIPADRNDWNEVRYQSGGRDWEYISPIRINNYKFRAVDKEFIRLADVGSGTPSPFPKRINGARLNYEETLEWKRLTNELDIEGNEPLNADGSDNKDWQGRNTLMQRLKAQLTDEAYLAMDDDDKANQMKFLVNQYRGMARRALLMSSQSLQERTGQISADPVQPAPDFVLNPMEVDLPVWVGN